MFSGYLNGRTIALTMHFRVDDGGGGGLMAPHSGTRDAGGGRDRALVAGEGHKSRLLGAYMSLPISHSNMLQTMLEHFFPVTPAPCRHPRGGVFVPFPPEQPHPRPRTQAVLSQLFPNSAMFLGNWRATSHLQHRLLNHLTVTLQERQLLNQDHAAHVRMNELLCDHRHLPPPPCHPAGPPEASFALRLPHDAPSTPQEHQNNARVVMRQAARSAAMFQDFWQEVNLAHEIHNMADTDSRGYSYEMEQRIELFKARLGPATRLYLNTHPVIYQINIAGGSVRVLSPHYDNYMATVVEDETADFFRQTAGAPVAPQAAPQAPDDASDCTTVVDGLFDGLPGSSSIPTSAPSPDDTPPPPPPLTRIAIEFDHEFRARHSVVLNGGAAVASTLVTDDAVPVGDDAVPVGEAHENFWQGAGGDEGEGHENGWLTDLIEEADAEGL
ncbi:hypothetical protein B0H17DRAFT_1135697 [Mycena rosella]|uniref:Uncharacterized protein n=1 Tax=Mycena rosella TaxID=1033263 RepID=A0AAD7DCR9_MYCRO|nr:hypothetical protein B0H17DRAFT_1135697 [Mycena rosella]